MSFKIPEYTELEIALTCPSRIYSEDRKYRIIWGNHFLRGFDNELDAKNSIRFFSSFLQNIKFIKG